MVKSHKTGLKTEEYKRGGRFAARFAAHRRSELARRKHLAQLRREHRVDACGLQKVGGVVGQDLRQLRALRAARKPPPDLGHHGHEGVVAERLLLQVVRAQAADALEMGETGGHDGVEHEAVDALTRAQATVPEHEPASGGRGARLCAAGGS